MAIQSRRGAYGDFDPDKMLPGEWASVLKDDPKAQDGKAVYMCFSAGDVKRMATYEDMKNNIQEATAEIIKQAKEEVTEDTKAAKESAAQAESSAKTAEEKASAAEKSASNAEKSAEASRTALESANKNFSDQYTKKTYKKGETCIQNNVLYEANADIDTEEDWNATHWTETSVEKIRAKMRQELDTVNTKIDNITPDDTAVDGKPWTSKHIVDMLCPPLKVSGNPVQCYPVAGYPLGITASWEPTQEGTGDPSPDNIRPIKGRDSVEVERCGENLILFPYSSGIQEKNGLVIEPQQDGSIVVNGTALENTYYIFEKNLEKRVPLNTVMALSGCPVGGDMKNGYYIGLYMSGKWSVDSGAGNTNVICNSRNISSRIEITIIKGTVCDNLIFWPKLEIGDKITPYCKYQGDTTMLTLPETIYGGSVDAVSGDGEKDWKCIALNGSEKWNTWGVNKLTEGVTGFYTYDVSDYDFSAIEKSISSQYLYNTGAFSGRVIGIGFAKAAPAYLMLSISNTLLNDISSNNAAINSLKAYLSSQYAAGTPVQVAYKIATVASFSATGNAPVKALSGINTVLTDADSVEVIGREDLPHAIAGQ